MFSMSRSTKKFPQLKMCDNCEELFLLKFIFLLTRCFWLLLKIINYMVFLTAILISYIKGGTPAQICLEKGSAMTRATFVIFLPKLLSFIDWCYYTQVSYTGSWEPLVFIIVAHTFVLLSILSGAPDGSMS
jgi:hypothetical protein